MDREPAPSRIIPLPDTVVKHRVSGASFTTQPIYDVGDDEF
jgi:hypothetical protein